MQAGGKKQENTGSKVLFPDSFTSAIVSYVPTTTNK